MRRESGAERGNAWSIASGIALCITWGIAGVFALGCVAPAPAEEAPPARSAHLPRPFTSSYAVAWNGITAGTATLELVRESDDRYLYSSRIVAFGLFRIAFPDPIVQSSTLTLEGGALQPLDYSASDGSRDRSRDIALTFDPSTHRITGTAERRSVNLALKPGTLDPMSVQLAMIRVLEAGGQPTHFLMVDKDEVKEYLYTPEGTEHLHTALGDFDTVIWSSSRPDSDRVTRMWYAPKLGFVPVRAEQLRAGKLQLRMSIRAFNRS
jgi:hypothetical protein